MTIYLRNITISLIVGLTALLLFPTVASAEPTTQRDVLVKGASSSAVYYLASDGKRYVFPNERTFKSWFTNFDGLLELSDEDLASFGLGGNVTYRPGIRMVKITTDPKVYAVGKGGELRHITSEAIAIKLFGTDWNKKIDDVPDAFFVNYHIGNPINRASDFNPTSVAQAVLSIAVDKDLPESVNARRSNTAPQIGDADVNPTDDAEPDAMEAMETKVFNLTGVNFIFSETEIRVNKGDAVKIIFTSNGGFHDWANDKFRAFTERVNAGETSEVTFVADEAGTFEYYCSVGNHRSLGMVGSLIVE